MQMDEMLSSWPKLQRRSRSEDIYTHNCTQLPNSEKHSFHMENTHAEGVPLSKKMSSPPISPSSPQFCWEGTTPPFGCVRLGFHVPQTPRPPSPCPKNPSRGPPETPATDHESIPKRGSARPNPDPARIFFLRCRSHSKPKPKQDQNRNFKAGRPSPPGRPGRPLPPGPAPQRFADLPFARSSEAGDMGGCHGKKWGTQQNWDGNVASERNLRAGWFHCDPYPYMTWSSNQTQTPASSKKCVPTSGARRPP